MPSPKVNWYIQPELYTFSQVQTFCLDWSQGKWTIYKETRKCNKFRADKIAESHKKDFCSCCGAELLSA